MDHSLEPAEKETEHKRWHSDDYLKALGITYWLEGDESKAAECWRIIVEALSLGRVSYSDMAGGVGSGLLLWFAAVRLSRPDLTDWCHTLFDKLSKRKWMGGINSWPGPVGKLFLGRIDESGFMDAVTKVEQLRERELCQAYFARAILALAKGNERGYKEFLKQVAALPSPAHIEREFFLARSEISLLGEKCESFS